VQVYFEERPIFGKEDLILGARATGGKKEACRKRWKSSTQKKTQHGKKEEKPNRNRVRVFDKDCNGYKPEK
jgi:hypothetical protein